MRFVCFGVVFCVYDVFYGDYGLDWLLIELLQRGLGFEVVMFCDYLICVFGFYIG